MLKSIIEFQKAGGHTVAYSTDKDYVPSIEDRKLRLKLIFEELSELAFAYGLCGTFSKLCTDYIEDSFLNKNAIDTKTFNKEESLDALCDLSVVVNGGYCISGFTDIAQEAYEETMKSNMSKFCYSLDEALATVANKEDWTYKQVVVNSKIIYAILRKEDGKIMKSPAFYKPDYSKLLNKDGK